MSRVRLHYLSLRNTSRMPLYCPISTSRVSPFMPSSALVSRRTYIPSLLPRGNTVARSFLRPKEKVWQTRNTEEVKRSVVYCCTL